MSGKINASVHPALHLAGREKTGLQGKILGKARENLMCAILGTWLTHLCLMYGLILINWMSPISILGLLGGIVHFYSNFKRNFCLQTVENLIRCRFLRHLIWFCTVCRCPTKRTLIWFCTFCRCPTKRTLGLYG